MSEQSRTNNERIFAEVVSIDAWHDRFDNKTAAVDLHAQVVFTTARLGGEPESPVRFRLSLRRAELAVVIPRHEQAGVDRGTVVRTTPAPTIKRTWEDRREAKTKLDAGGRVKIGARGVSAAAHLATELGGKITRIETTKGTEKIVAIKVTHRFDHTRSSDHWDFEPGTGEVLSGAWPTPQNRLLKLVDQRTNRKRTLEPSVRLELRCRREDLHVTDIEIKNADLWTKVLERARSPNGMKAAEAYITKKLTELGLEVGDLSEKFARVTLAQIYALNGPVPE